MKIAPSLFEAFAKCPIQCWLRAKGEPPTGSAYAEWVKTQNESFRAIEAERLLAEIPEGESARSPSPDGLKTAKRRLAVDVVAQASSPASSGSVSLPERTPGETPGQPADGISAPPPHSALRTPHSESEARLHAVERVPSEGRGKAARFIPIRFIFFHKLTKDDKLLLAFDAFVLGQALGRDIAFGKIIHGDRGCARQSAANSEAGANEQDVSPTSAALSRAQPQVTRVKTSALASEVRKRLEKIATLLSSPAPPDLVLNRHCAECE